MPMSKHYSTAEGYTHLINPGELDITNLQFGILNLAPESTFFDHSDDCEVGLIALEGQCTLLVGHNGNKANGILGERADVFDGDACVAYIPHHTTYEVLTQSDKVEIAICKTSSHKDTAAIILEAEKIKTQVDYQLRIIENNSSVEMIGEAICFYRFKGEKGAATLKIIDSAKKTARIVLHNNDLLVLPEKTRARLITYEGECYQLLITHSTPLQ
ncbi:5-deoxy-glucuronate isomerase [Candidatus Poribacteria bacterium]|nr:5-deoxy-glucuronate isomerase [Candidatus Poribacteria bacterium]